MRVSPEFAARLARYADVIVRVGLNLEAGQRLLLAEPFELQGVTREATELVEAVEAAAVRAGAAGVDVIWGDESRWHAVAARGGDRVFEREVERNGERLRAHARDGGALLFLPSSHPHLMRGIPAERIARLREVGWRAYGRVAPDLIAARTNWTTAPAPTATWARVVFGTTPLESEGDRAEPKAVDEGALAQLWSVVFAACRADAAEPIAAWHEHLVALERQRDALNQQAVRAIHFVGEGTDLRIELAPAPVWCTANLRRRDGRTFVANLPTEEIFTAPDRAGANGCVRIARPVAYGGGIIEGAELEFAGGRVVKARATAGEDLLRRLLATDDGAARLGEVALVPRPLPALTRAHTCFRHTLLDENALPHIALGEGYPFTVGPAGAAALNHSLVHLDLPMAAEYTLA